MKIFSITNRIYLTIFILLLTSCGGNPDVQVNETSNNATSYDETIHINNCGGKADSQQTKSRSFSTDIQGGIDVGIEKIVKGIISAKYSQSQNASVSQSLIAPPGTNMEFVLRWSEEIHAGNVTANGSTGTYTVSIPIAVEQVSSQDLGDCNGNTQISPTNELTNWAFSLERHFPAGFWSAGTHSYSLAFTCPNESPDSITREFSVSNDFSLISGDVYLRWSALRIGNPWGEVVDGINPSQPTIASVAWDTISKSEADSRISNCTGTISWDGGTVESLTGVSFQH